ncbi:ubiquinone biosynthesis O-methyltransferase, mitochondrial isoform X2 [Ooceraea biroi]|nr:ubiquinone biosynthesis O-methyltransferase, mitochondrial isoform X2 [Ooceraea biroi]XP_011339910.1 ubiquinone biosynthesis O-methyltransferase, mitochondrial isoform X2 [Ooceraea biroi]EZA53649.1 Hexaprenyldihydroxybenzoate methyltransferase, mitochondrial [Ooceraea biroi]
MANAISTVDPKEIDHHSDWKHFWWDVDGKAKLLHAFNPVRLEFIRKGLADIDFESRNPTLPLNGIKIADIGCGGGILTEFLARAGAQVTGIDAATDLIDVAKEHVQLDPTISDRVNYFCTTIEEFSLNNKESYDAVVASEVVEHVTDPELFLKESVKILKPGGSIFVTTINKTLASWLGAIIIAEYIWKKIPCGTHHWSKFIAPDEIERILEKYDCKTNLIEGIVFNPLSYTLSLSSYKGINYAVHAVKKKKIDA